MNKPVLNIGIKFVDGLGATSGNGAGSGSMLIAWGSRAVVALKRMEANGVLWNFLENRRDITKMITVKGMGC